MKSLLVLAIALTQFLLPVDYPAKPVLNDVCRDRSAFESREQAERAGFQHRDKSGQLRPWTIMVLGHPRLEGYLIKTYPLGKEDALRRYVRRIGHARRLADYIEKKGCRHLVVPQKWLYELPGDEGGYVVIAEGVPILPGSYAGGPTLQAYKEISEERLQELVQALIDLGGCDAWPQNIPFTVDGKIAFIDTDHLGHMPGDFVKRLIPYLSPEMGKVAGETWKRSRE